MLAVTTRDRAEPSVRGHGTRTVYLQQWRIRRDVVAHRPDDGAANNVATLSGVTTPMRLCFAFSRSP
jgi:hypothetical protein